MIRILKKKNYPQQSGFVAFFHRKIALATRIQHSQSNTYGNIFLNLLEFLISVFVVFFLQKNCISNENPAYYKNSERTVTVHGVNYMFNVDLPIYLSCSDMLKPTWKECRALPIDQAIKRIVANVKENAVHAFALFHKLQHNQQKGADELLEKLFEILNAHRTLTHRQTINVATIAKNRGIVKKVFDTQKGFTLQCASGKTRMVNPFYLHGIPYFQTVMSNGMQESKNRCIVFPKMSDKVLDLLVEYLVTGSTSYFTEKTKPEHRVEFLNFVDMIGIPIIDSIIAKKELSWDDTCLVVDMAAHFDHPLSLLVKWLDLDRHSNLEFHL